MNIVPPPPFSYQLLKPKYWSVWLAFGSLAILVNVLPYVVLRILGRSIGCIAMHVMKRRHKIALRNLQLCFPDFTDWQCKDVVRKNFQYTGMAIIETGIAWFWPDWRIRRITSIVGKDRLLAEEKNGRGVLVVCSHHLNLEITARIFSQFAQGYGVYRPNSNPAYEFIQHRGRTRFGHQMIDRKDVKSMLKVLKSGHRLLTQYPR